jgi:hypothetical protein
MMLAQQAVRRGAFENRSHQAAQAVFDHLAVLHEIVGHVPKPFFCCYFAHLNQGRWRVY